MTTHNLKLSLYPCHAKHDCFTSPLCILLQNPYLRAIISECPLLNLMLYFRYLLPVTWLSGLRFAKLFQHSFSSKNCQFKTSPNRLSGYAIFLYNQLNVRLLDYFNLSSRGGLEVEQWSDIRTLFISVDQSPLGACMITWYQWTRYVASWMCVVYNCCVFISEPG